MTIGCMRPRYRRPQQRVAIQNRYSALTTVEGDKVEDDEIVTRESTVAPRAWLYPRERRQKLKPITKIGCTARCKGNCDADALEFANFKLSKFDSIETIVNTDLSDLAKSKLENQTKSRMAETVTSPVMMFNQVPKAQNLLPVSQKEELKTRLGKF